MKSERFAIGAPKDQGGFAYFYSSRNICTLPPPKQSWFWGESVGN